MVLQEGHEMGTLKHGRPRWVLGMAVEWQGGGIFLWTWKFPEKVQFYWLLAKFPTLLDTVRVFGWAIFVKQDSHGTHGMFFTMKKNPTILRE